MPQGNVGLKARNQVFLVIEAEIPVRWLYIADDVEDLDKEYDPSLFRLTLSDGRQLPGQLIQDSNGFSPGFVERTPRRGEREESMAMESVSVAWQVEQKTIIHGLRLQYKDRPTILVPDGTENVEK